MWSYVWRIVGNSKQQRIAVVFRSWYQPCYKRRNVNCSGTGSVYIVSRAGVIIFEWFLFYICFSEAGDEFLLEYHRGLPTPLITWPSTSKVNVFDFYCSVLCAALRRHLFCGKNTEFDSLYQQNYKLTKILLIILPSLSEPFFRESFCSWRNSCLVWYVALSIVLLSSY